MLSAEIAISVVAGLFTALVVIHFSLQVIDAVIPPRQAMFVKPIAVPAALYAWALWKAEESPYVAVTIAILATLRLGIFAAIVIAALALTKWEEALVEAVF